MLVCMSLGQGLQLNFSPYLLLIDSKNDRNIRRFQVRAVQSKDGSSGLEVIVFIFYWTPLGLTLLFPVGQR